MLCPLSGFARTVCGNARNYLKTLGRGLNRRGHQLHPLVSGENLVFT
jgi:hypothetical protein